MFDSARQMYNVLKKEMPFVAGNTIIFHKMPEKRLH